MDQITQGILEAKKIILGEDKSLGYYFAGEFFATLGILISLYWSSRKRNKLSPDTPYHFSWLFLIWDNCKKAGITLIVEFILFRCFDLHAVLMMLAVGILVSASLDQILEFLMNQSDKLCQLLGMNRQKFPEKFGIKPGGYQDEPIDAGNNSKPS
jgi:hypothetical protein